MEDTVVNETIVFEPLDRDLIACTNCGSSSAGLYCASCGQRHRTPHDFRLSHFFHHAFEEFTSLDSKIFRSLKSLLFFPGQLTAEWIAGRQKSYILPLRLFILVNIGYFLWLQVLPNNTLTMPLRVQYKMESYSESIRPIVDKKIRESKLSFAQFAEKYNAATSDQAKSLIILMVPMFALLLMLMYLRTGHYFVEHLVFSLHFFAFFLILTSVGLSALQYLIELFLPLFHTRESQIDWDETFSYIPAIIMIVYLTFALHHTYGTRWRRSILRAGVLSAGVFFIMMAYRLILFFTTIYTMRLN